MVWNYYVSMVLVNPDNTHSRVLLLLSHKIEKNQLNIIEIGQNYGHVEIKRNDECDGPVLYTIISCLILAVSLKPLN